MYTKKASTIGCWGETGRYPLIYQSIKLTLNYFKRINNQNTGSLVHAALTEQKNMGLKWYKNVKSLLKLDTLFHKDHVTAFNFLKQTKTSVEPTSDNHLKTPILDHNKFRIAIPIPSEKFKVENIVKRLKDHFVNCWKYEKSSSIKLSLHYDKIKHIFCKEQYLDYVKNASNRHKTTQIRISAHDLEIESGRYKKIIRGDRICKWCHLSMGTSEIENENHMLFICDFYAPIRSKLLKTLHCAVNGDLINSSNNDQGLEDFKLALQNISISSLHKDFPKLQSPSTDLLLAKINSIKTSVSANINCSANATPYTKANLTSVTATKDINNITHPTHFHQHDTPHDPLQFHFNPQSDQNSTFLDNIRSFIQNALASFTRRCFEKRATFLKELSKSINFNDID